MRFSFNRTSMELKRDTRHYHRSISDDSLLIEPVWN